jgi:hypothetical protein
MHDLLACAAASCIVDEQYRSIDVHDVLWPVKP